MLEQGVLGKQCYIQINGTFASNYREGIYEGRRGYIVSVFDPQSVMTTNAEQEANVKLDGEESTMAILLPYLTPLQPESVKDQVLALDGPNKGKEFIVQELSDSVCVVSPIAGGVMVDVRKEILVKIKKRDM